MKESNSAGMRLGFGSVTVVVCRLHGNWGEPGVTLLKRTGLAQLDIMLVSFELEPSIWIRFIWGVVNYQNNRHQV